ncbi:MAG: glutamine amidotransferase [Lachnospiraceae bacterium]|nr:glutamine amidotransferase [Lachnospiraceae bacterium]
MNIRIGHLYPDLLNLYGDRGNIRCMMKRLSWRGIDAELVEYKLNDKVNFNDCDIFLLGGGSDREQKLVCKELSSIKKDFKKYVEDMGVVIAICGGYQLLGAYYQMDDESVEGLELVDLYTVQGEGRLIGNITIKSDLFDMPITGFENHGGRTTLGEGVTPLGKVVNGFGNDGNSGYEGVIYKNVIGTYLHGPLLPKNPQVCDYILAKSLSKKYGKDIILDPLDDSAEDRANNYSQALN